MRRMQLVMAAATCVAAVARPVAAQSFVSDDPVIKRIWAIGMDSSETMHLSDAVRLDRAPPHGFAEPQAWQRLAREDVCVVGDRRQERAVRYLARLAPRLFAH